MSGALVAVALFVERVLDRQLAAVLERIERIEEEIKENGAMGRAIHDQLAVRDQWIAAKADIVDGRRAGPGRHFNELSLALVDLNAGAKPSLLAPPKGRKTPDPSRRWGSRARVALLVRDLMMSGMTEKNAATKIAKDYPDLVKIAGAKANRPEANLVDTILNWHKRFLAKRVNKRSCRVAIRAGTRRTQKIPHEIENAVGVLSPPFQYTDRIGHLPRTSTLVGESEG